MISSKDLLIIKKYAEALAKVKLSEDIINQLEMIKSLINDNPEFGSFLANPSIKKEVKAELIKKTFSGTVELEVINTLLVLLEKRRVNLFSSLADAYKEIYNKENNVSTAEISAGQEIKDSELNSIKDKLEKLFNKNITVTQTIDSSISAGMRIKVENKVIDSTLEKKMRDLKDLLNI